MCFCPPLSFAWSFSFISIVFSWKQVGPSTCNCYIGILVFWNRFLGLFDPDLYVFSHRSGFDLVMPSNRNLSKPSRSPYACICFSHLPNELYWRQHEKVPFFDFSTELLRSSWNCPLAYSLKGRSTLDDCWVNIDFMLKLVFYYHPSNKVIRYQKFFRRKSHAMFLVSSNQFLDLGKVKMVQGLGSSSSNPQGDIVLNLPL